MPDLNTVEFHVKHSRECKNFGRQETWGPSLNTKNKKERDVHEIH